MGRKHEEESLSTCFESNIPYNLRKNINSINTTCIYTQNMTKHNVHLSIIYEQTLHVSLYSYILVLCEYTKYQITKLNALIGIKYGSTLVIYLDHH